MEDLEKLAKLYADIKAQYSYDEFIKIILERFEDSFESIEDVYFELNVFEED